MGVLLVEDEMKVAAFIRNGFEEAGYGVMTAFDGPTGKALATQQAFDVIILDVILPGLNGMELCRELRQGGVRTPIILLTALGDTDHLVKGLEAGADDFIAKPFKFRELLARSKALLRRSQTVYSPKEFILADLILNEDSKSVTRSGVELTLSTKEFRLLQHLLKNKERVVSRAELLEEVWDVQFDTGTNVVEVYINYLRRKVDKDRTPKLIHTVIGRGYVLKVRDEA